MFAVFPVAIEVEFYDGLIHRKGVFCRVSFHLCLGDVYSCASLLKCDGERRDGTRTFFLFFPILEKDE